MINSSASNLKMVEESIGVVIFDTPNKMVKDKTRIDMAGDDVHSRNKTM